MQCRLVEIKVSVEQYIHIVTKYWTKPSVTRMHCTGNAAMMLLYLVCIMCVNNYRKAVHDSMHNTTVHKFTDQHEETRI